MSLAITEAASIRLRPGVLFAAARTGGTLMDLTGDRYIALGQESALIWSMLADGHGRADVAERLAETARLDRAAAAARLEQQLRLWEAAQLVMHEDGPRDPLPDSKRPRDTAVDEIDENAVAGAPLDLFLLAKLMLAETAFRRRLRTEGLARTLVRLQAETAGEHGGDSMPALYRTVRAYRALRRAYKQSQTSHDCLIRSLALTAILCRKGVRADLCFGVIDLPFQAHAWVEADGLVVNEPLSTRREYAVIGRF